MSKKERACDWTLSTSTFGKEANTLAAKIEAEIKREGELAMKITEAPDDLLKFS